MLLSKEPTLLPRAPEVVTQSVGPRLGVAVVTSRRYSMATPPRIEGMMCPLNRGILGHLRDITFLRIRVLKEFYRHSQAHLAQELK